MERFDFVNEISKLNDRKKSLFYAALVHELTIVNRILINDHIGESEENLNSINATNELMHKMANRVLDILLCNGTWKDSDSWDLIQDMISANSKIQSEVGGAVLSAYKRTIG